MLLLLLLLVMVLVLVKPLVNVFDTADVAVKV